MPGQKYTFGVVKAAQARGDFEVLAERGRRALRVHISGDLEAGLMHFPAPSTRRCSNAREAADGDRCNSV